MSIASAVAILFLVMDPLGNIPVFLAVLKNFDPAKKRKIIVRECIIAFLVLAFFLFVGRFILNLLYISQSSLGMAGGVILLLIAIKMIFSGSEKIFEMSDISEPFIVPLAVPAVAGPSAMTTIILITAAHMDLWYKWLFVLFVAWLLTSIILFFSIGLGRLLGKKGLSACERLMGMLLAAVAVEMFVKGLHQYLSANPTPL